MPRYKRIFSTDIAHTQVAILECIKLAERLEKLQPGTGAATAARYRKVLLELNRGLNDIARETAIEADKAIGRWITKTKSGRPLTGNKPNLRSSIKSRPLHRHGRSIGTGEVGVADIDILDELVNPRYPQYGPYWRAQEQGTKNQKGREVYGGFYGKGLSSGPFKPAAAESRRHPLFVSARVAGAAYASLGFRGGPGARGGKGGGKMIIGEELKPRRFIERGANEAELIWRAKIAALEQRARKDLLVVTRPSRGPGRRRRP